MPSIDSLIERSVCDMLDRDSRKALRAEMDRALSRQDTGAVVAGRLKRPDGQTREVEIALAELMRRGVLATEA